MMEVELKHDNLNLFRYFGGQYKNENNLTRALLCLLSRSPWGMTVLSGLLDLLSKNYPKLASFQGIPEGISFSMQEGVANADFLPDETTTAVLVGLEPYVVAKTDPDSKKKGEDEVEGSGIVDATILLRKNERLLALVIESKLYGRVGRNQWARYRKAISQQTGQPPLEAHVTWDAIDGLIDGLPNEAQADPLVRDFSDLIRERPHLVSFPAFRSTDFNQGWPLDGRLKRLCLRLKDERLGDLTVIDLERKRGGFDYDLRLEESGLTGNIGVASWDHKTIASKLVVGSRTLKETNHILGHSADSPEVLACLKEAASTRRLSLSVSARVYFHRFDERWFGLRLGEQRPDRDSVAAEWTTAVELARSLHRVSCLKDDDLKKFSRALPANEDNEALVSEIMQIRPKKKRPRIFIAFTICLNRVGMDLAKKKPDDQLRLITGDLTKMGELLVALSG